MSPYSGVSQDDENWAPTRFFVFFVTSFHWYILPVVLSQGQNVLSVLSVKFASSLYITVSWKLKLLMATNKTLKDSGICKISTDKAEPSYCNISSRFCKSDYQYFQKNSINCISAFFLSSNLLSVSFIGACCLPFRSIKVAKFWTTMMNFSNFPPSVSETEPPGKFCNAFLRLENVHKLNIHVFKMGLTGVKSPWGASTCGLPLFVPAFICKGFQLGLLNLKV